jgi:hypothetical protein
MIAHFESIGLDQVRLKLAKHAWGHWNPLAVAWVKDQDQAASLSREANRAEAILHDRSADSAAWAAVETSRSSLGESKEANVLARDANSIATRANRIATAALAMALIAIILSIIALVGHHGS